MAQYSRKLKKGIKWWYKFDYNAKTYISKCIYLSKSEAKKAEIDKYEEVTNQERNSIQKPILSLLDAIEERLDYILTKKSKAYYRENKRYYTKLYKALGDQQIDKIQKSEINAILLEMSQKLQTEGKGNYAVNAALRIFKALFSLAIKNHELDMKNPCVGIELYSIDKRMKYIPSNADIHSVRNTCDEGQKLLVDFVMETGCRISEALRVTGKDLGEGYVILYTRKSKNSNLVPRKVPMTLTLPVIKSDERLFERWQDIPRFLEDKVRKLKQPAWSWHNLRHRKASIWANKEKKPIYEVMSLLGHSNIETTQLYLQMIS